jgi:hypothetical protein
MNETFKIFEGPQTPVAGPSHSLLPASCLLFPVSS